MAGILQNTPWNVGPYSTFAPYGSPTQFGQPSPFGQQAQIQQLQQLLQITSQQIQQLQYTIQVLPQHVAQLVVQTLIQSQGNVSALGQAGFGSPFQSIPTTSPFSAGQPGYVM